MTTPAATVPTIQEIRNALTHSTTGNHATVSVKQYQAHVRRLLGDRDRLIGMIAQAVWAQCRWCTHPECDDDCTDAIDAYLDAEAEAHREE